LTKSVLIAAPFAALNVDTHRSQASNGASDKGCGIPTDSRITAAARATLERQGDWVNAADARCLEPLTHPAG
jgi:hypothetical protein